MKSIHKITPELSFTTTIPVLMTAKTQIQSHVQCKGEIDIKKNIILKN